MRYLFSLTVALALIFQAGAQSRIERVCPDGTHVNVHIRWKVPDTCQQVIFGLLYGSADGATFSVVDTVVLSDVIYVHTDALNQSNTWYYYLHYLVKCGTQVHWLTSDTVELDNISPDSVMFRRVTVENGRVRLYWEHSDTTVAYFLIYSADSPATPSTILDTAMGPSSYEVPMTTSAFNRVYRVAAVDSCGNVSLISLPLAPVQLHYTPDPCLPYLYFRMSAPALPVYLPLEAYLLVYSDTGLYDRVPLDTLGQTTLRYDIRNYPFDSMRVVIQYIGGAGDTAYSNAFWIPTTDVYLPPSLQIENITVEDSTLWIISRVMHPQNMAAATLERRTPVGTYEPVLHLSTFNEWVRVADTAADPNLQSYIYRWKYEGKCGDRGQTLARDNSLHLHMTKGENGYVMRWNFYTTWPAVDSYYIQRLILNKGDRVQVAAFDYATTLGYLPNQPDVDSLFDTVCYRLEVRRPATASGVQWLDTAHSNWQCFLPMPRIWIPTAFRPFFGVNKVFQPVILNADTNHYQLFIFNRWGEQLFYTTRITEGWDGLDPNDEPYPEGVYLYHITYYSTDGRKFQARGEVFLLW